MDCSERFEWLLFTPPGKTTRILNKHFPFISDYLKPGDRIAWHRPYVLIHEATVLDVSPHTSKIVVVELHTNPVVLGGNLERREIELKGEYGQLYRYDYERNTSDVDEAVRNLLQQLGNFFGYNIFAQNCQHMTERTHTTRDESFQTRWFLLSKVLVDTLAIPFAAEFIEHLCGGKELIGLISTVVLHVVFFLAKFSKAYQKLKRGSITWVHFTTLICRELLMATGDIVIKVFAYKFKINVPTGSPLLQAYFLFVLVLTGAFVIDALLLWSGLISPDSSFRYVALAVGSMLGLGLSICSTGWFLEFLFAAILGFTAQFIAHGLYHAGSWLYNWLRGQTIVDCRVVNDVTDLEAGDHITNYEHWYHPSCHAIFLEYSERNMTIIKNTYSKGVIKTNVPFVKGNVYRYSYHSSECQNDEDVVRVARSKIGTNNYNWFTNNCKTFAKKCKCEREENNVPGMNNAQAAVDVPSIINDIASDENLSPARRRLFASVVG